MDIIPILIIRSRTVPVVPGCRLRSLSVSAVPPINRGTREAKQLEDWTDRSVLPTRTREASLREGRRDKAATTGDAAPVQTPRNSSFWVAVLVLDLERVLVSQGSEAKVQYELRLVYQAASILIAKATIGRKLIVIVIGRRLPVAKLVVRLKERWVVNSIRGCTSFKLICASREITRGYSSC